MAGIKASMKLAVLALVIGLALASPPKGLNRKLAQSSDTPSWATNEERFSRIYDLKGDDEVSDEVKNQWENWRTQITRDLKAFNNAVQNNDYEKARQIYTGDGYENAYNAMQAMIMEDPQPLNNDKQALLDYIDGLLNDTLPNVADSVSDEDRTSIRQVSLILAARAAFIKYPGRHMLVGLASPEEDLSQEQWYFNNHAEAFKLHMVIGNDSQSAYGLTLAYDDDMATSYAASTVNEAQLNPMLIRNGDEEGLAEQYARVLKDFQMSTVIATKKYAYLIAFPEGDQVSPGAWAEANAYWQDSRGVFQNPSAVEEMDRIVAYDGRGLGDFNESSWCEAKAIMHSNAMMIDSVNDAVIVDQLKEGASNMIVTHEDYGTYREETGDECSGVGINLPAESLLDGSNYSEWNEWLNETSVDYGKYEALLEEGDLMGAMDAFTNTSLWSYEPPSEFIGTETPMVPYAADVNTTLNETIYAAFQGSGAFSDRSESIRAEAVGKLTQCVLFRYVTHHLQGALAELDAKQAVEAFGIYYGRDGNSQLFDHMLEYDEFGGSELAYKVLEDMGEIYYTLERGLAEGREERLSKVYSRAVRGIIMSFVQGVAKYAPRQDEGGRIEMASFAKCLEPVMEYIEPGLAMEVMNVTAFDSEFLFDDISDADLPGKMTSLSRAMAVTNYSAPIEFNEFSFSAEPIMQMPESAPQ